MKFLAALLLFVAPSLLPGAEWVLTARSPRPAPAGLEFTERSVTDGSATATIWTVSFAPKTHTFAVMDNPEGAYDLGSAAAKRGALAGVNGGYFHPDRTPLGLVVRQGGVLHQAEKGSLISGVI